MKDSAPRPRILFLSNTFESIYNFWREVIQSLLDQGVEVYAAALPTRYEEELRAMGCVIEHVQLSRHGSNPMKDLLFLRRCMELFRKVAPTLIFSFTIKPNIYGAMAAHLTGYPIVCSITGTGPAFLHSGPRSMLIRLLYRLALRLSRRVFFQNEDDMNYFLRHRLLHGNGELLPWGSGVNLEAHRLLPMPPDEVTHFVYVGRIMRLKGVDTFFTCAERMKREELPCRFHVAGVEDEPRHEKTIQRLVREGIIDYHGFCYPIDPILAQCHCVVLPSLGGEGVPNCLMESCACGRACIASDVNGSRNVVVEGRNGYLFPAGDADALYSCMKRFMALPWQEKKHMGLAGRQHAEAHYDRNSVVERYVQEVQWLLKESDATP